MAEDFSASPGEEFDALPPPEQASLPVCDPATGDIFDRVPIDDRASLDAKVKAADQAFASWRKSTVNERASVLQAFAKRLRENAEPLAQLLVREGGKPLIEAMSEVEDTAGSFDYYAGLIRSRGGRLAPPNSHTSMNLVIKEPIGVVGAILPFNYPLLLWAWKAAPALAAGNCVIAKPSPDTPLSLPAAVALFELPENVHQIVQGEQDIGEALIDHPGVGKIAFTGSVAGGKAILHRCADQVKRCSVELSGHDAMIVWDDVDIDLAVEAVLFAAFTNAGQVCTSSERIYVRETIFDSFRDKLAARARQLRVGDPGAIDTDVGPVVSERHLARLEEYIARAVGAGASIICGGERIDRPGVYLAPTVLTGLDHDQLNSFGEIFGPIAPLVPVHSFDEAIRLANDNRFGLSANVLTSNLALAMQATRDLRVGTVWINNPLIDNFDAPFGGFRQAGMGRELGPEGLDAYTETKHVSLEFQLIEQPWWFAARHRES
jgi:acyl-CoA reductase-like NAD-dependent aldehyde dehydrogenase